MTVEHGTMIRRTVFVAVVLAASIAAILALVPWGDDKEPTAPEPRIAQPVIHPDSDEVDRTRPFQRADGTWMVPLSDGRVVEAKMIPFHCSDGTVVERPGYVGGPPRQKRMPIQRRAR